MCVCGFWAAAAGLLVWTRWLNNGVCRVSHLARQNTQTGLDAETTHLRKKTRLVNTDPKLFMHLNLLMQPDKLSLMWVRHSEFIVAHTSIDVVPDKHTLICFLQCWIYCCTCRSTSIAVVSDKHILVCFRHAEFIVAHTSIDVVPDLFCEMLNLLLHVYMYFYWRSVLHTYPDLFSVYWIYCCPYFYFRFSEFKPLAHMPYWWNVRGMFGDMQMRLTISWGFTQWWCI